MVSGKYSIQDCLSILPLLVLPVQDEFLVCLSSPELVNFLRIGLNVVFSISCHLTGEEAGCWCCGPE